MPLNLTEEQIIQLAPDAASVKAGKGLAVPGKWVLLACSERAVWGHCQGSGKNPYQTAIDLNDIAFKCSCPSRKFPCKHGLGLLLLFAAKPELFEQAEEPDWVATWLSKRGVKAEKKEQKARDEKPVDAAAQARNPHRLRPETESAEGHHPLPGPERLDGNIGCLFRYLWGGTGFPTRSQHPHGGIRYGSSRPDR